MEVLIQQQNNDKLHVHVMCNTKYSIQIDIQIVWWWYQLDNAVLWSLSGLKLSVALFNDFSWLHVYMHMLILKYQWNNKKEETLSPALTVH